MLFKGTGNGELIIGTPWDDLMYGRGGNDRITGAGGNDFVGGGAGDDYLWGAEGTDQVYGQRGDDHLAGGQGAFDQLFGGAGNDELLIGESHYGSAYGGAGKDRLSGFDAPDAAYDNDMLYGGGGNDSFVTEGDYAYGGAGNDKFYAIASDIGCTFLQGGRGKDTFHWAAIDDDWQGSTVVISDWHNGIDKLEISLLTTNGWARELSPSVLDTNADGCLSDVDDLNGYGDVSQQGDGLGGTILVVRIGLDSLHFTGGVTGVQIDALL